jgi:hypothetical protein
MKNIVIIDPVILIPCTYFIDNNGVAIEIIGGSVNTEKDLKEKIDKVMQIHKNTLPVSQSQNGSSNSSAINQQTNSPSSSSKTSTTTETTAETPVKSVTENKPKVDSSASTTPSNSNIESKVERANQLIEANREKKAKEEEEKAKRDEIERRKEAKEMQRAKHLREEKEAQEIIKQREKEKREEKIARERILAQIAADKEERKARQTSLNSENSVKQELSSNSAVNSDSVRERIHNKARIQFRLPDGSTKTNEFEANDTLATARQYLLSNLSFRNFSLATAFPRREFTENDYSQTLEELSLSPSAVLLIIPNQGINSSKAVTTPSIFWQFFAFIFIPFIFVWTIIVSYYNSWNTPDPNDQLDSNLSRLREKNAKKKFYKKDGNVARIRDPKKDDDSDDDNNTWNGNSTQQM